MLEIAAAPEAGTAALVAAEAGTTALVAAEAVCAPLGSAYKQNKKIK